MDSRSCKFDYLLFLSQIFCFLKTNCTSTYHLAWIKFCERISLIWEGTFSCRTFEPLELNWLSLVRCIKYYTIDWPKSEERWEWKWRNLIQVCMSESLWILILLLAMLLASRELTPVKRSHIIDIYNYIILFNN